MWQWARLILSKEDTDAIESEMVLDNYVYLDDQYIEAKPIRKKAGLRVSAVQTQRVLQDTT